MNASRQIRTACLLALVAAVLAALGVGAASAASPGGNGLLVYLQGDVGSTMPVGLMVSDGAQTREIGPRCGGEATPIAEVCPSDPVWSPDGSRLAFAQGDDLATINADGTDLRVIDLGSVRSPASPTWSPDSSELAFDAFETAGRRELYKVLADGSAGPRRVTFKGGQSPAWSSRGTIAFVRSKNIFKLTRAGVVSGVTTRGGYQPSWGPGGRVIAFVRKTDNSLRDAPTFLYRYDVAGRTALRRLTGRPASEPAWSPDGRSVLFTRREAGNSIIASVGAGGGDLRTVALGEEGRGRNVSSADLQPVP
jgi:TolB protein